MPRSNQLKGAPIVALVLNLIVGCGDTEPSNTGPTDTGPSDSGSDGDGSTDAGSLGRPPLPDPETYETVTMFGDVDITGDDPVAGWFRNPLYTDRPSCAAVANQGSTDDITGGYTFEVPGPHRDHQFEGILVEFRSYVALEGDYEGPGTYTSAVGQVRMGTAAAGINYFMEEAWGDVVVVVNPDASGSLDFADAVGNGAAERTVSGRISWTCYDPGTLVP